MGHAVPAVGGRHRRERYGPYMAFDVTRPCTAQRSLSDSRGFFGLHALQGLLLGYVLTVRREYRVPGRGAAQRLDGHPGSRARNAQTAERQTGGTHPAAIGVWHARPVFSLRLTPAFDMPFQGQTAHRFNLSVFSGILRGPVTTGA